MSPNIVFILVGLVFVVLILCEFREYYYGHQSKSWSNTNGTVLDAYVNTDEDMDADETHSPIVHYSYKVGGTLYKSSRLCFGSVDSYDYFKVASSLIGIAKNQKVRVYYDPLKPSKSVLQIGTGNVKPLKVTLYCLMFIAFLRYS